MYFNRHPSRYFENINTLSHFECIETVRGRVYSVKLSCLAAFAFGIKSMSTYHTMGLLHDADINLLFRFPRTFTLASELIIRPSKRANEG